MSLSTSLQDIDAVRFFSEYLRITGVAHTGPEKAGDPRLIGKRLGLINGGYWIGMWSYYFGRLYLPGVHLINVGSEAVQINFMQMHEKGLPVPPPSNIEAFARYAVELVEFAQVDAIMITCSTMNRSYPRVQEAVQAHGVPVIPIDGPMMERAVEHGGRILVVATLGSTVNSTQALLRETAERLGREVSFSGVSVPEAWDLLAAGDVLGHNQVLEAAIRAKLAEEPIGCVVLAQLSMTVFMLSHPDPVAEFGAPVLTSGQCGFERVRDILLAK